MTDGLEEQHGTPGWMSPEQLRGEERDARTDAFARDCLLPGFSDALGP